MTYKNIDTTLIIVEDAINMMEFSGNQRPNYSKHAMRAGLKIALSVIMDAMYGLQEIEEINFETRVDMAKECVKQLKKLIHTFTNITVEELYD